jgi:hypothetical protein
LVIHRRIVGGIRLVVKRRDIGVKLKAVDAKRVATGAILVREESTLHEKPLDLVLGATMLGRHVYP